MKVYVTASKYQHNSFTELNKFIGKDVWVLVNHIHAGKAWYRFLSVTSERGDAWYKVNITSMYPAFRNEANDKKEVYERKKEFLDIVQPEQTKTSQEIFSEDTFLKDTK